MQEPLSLSPLMEHKPRATESFQQSFITNCNGFSISPPNNSNSTRKASKTIKCRDLFTDLPSHIMVEVLLRLPPKTIVQCKSVCKLWLNVISDPEFISLHFSRSSPGLVVHQMEMFENYFKLVSFKDANDHHSISSDTTVRFTLNALSNYPDANIVVDGSIDGLLFLRDINYKHETLYILNPLTREYIELPKPRRVARYPGVVTHGCGVTQKSKVYKIVRIFHDRELDPRTGFCLRIPNSECQVYTLGLGKWRTIGEVPFSYDSRLVGLFFKGNIHWLVQDLVEGYELISCFDLENEFFQPILLPFERRKILGSLGVLRECLCLCDNTSEFDIDIWVMKKYGVEESWVKEVVIKKIPELIGPSFEVVQVLRSFRDGSIMIIWGDFFMLYYCTKSGACEEVNMDQSRGANSIEAMNYVPSFRSLRKLGKENVIMF